DLWSALLAAADFRPEVPTAWLAEGLLPYLQPEAVETLVRHVSILSAPGSRFAADFVSADLMAARNAYVASIETRTKATTGAIFHFGTNDPVPLLTRFGWQITSVKHPGEEGADFERWDGPQSVAAGFFFLFASNSCRFSDV